MRDLRGKIVTVTGLHCTRRGKRCRVIGHDKYTAHVKFDDDKEEIYGWSALDHGVTP